MSEEIELREINRQLRHINHRLWWVVFLGVWLVFLATFTYLFGIKGGVRIILPDKVKMETIIELKQ